MSTPTNEHPPTVDAIVSGRAHGASARIVTPEQLMNGFRILGASGAIWRGEYVVIRKLDDGNYLVEEPEPEVSR